MHRLYRRLFPVVVQLCCDADEVKKIFFCISIWINFFIWVCFELPKKLFQSLLDQIIHWFSSNVAYENPETMALLESLLVKIKILFSIVNNFFGWIFSKIGAENVVDAVVRDYSAKCVNEFFKWSIKHSTKDKSPMENNVRSLFKRLYTSANHPSCVKRLASCLIFNSIYRTFRYSKIYCNCTIFWILTFLREENNLVNKYTLELLAVYLNLLALADHDDESEG